MVTAVDLCRFYSCWHVAETATAESQGFSLDDSQLRADWASIVSLADHRGQSLDQTHVFVLAHILRRPILVYGVKVIENFRGEKLGPVNYEGAVLAVVDSCSDRLYACVHTTGVYLPLLWDSSFCTSNPIALAYTRGHFSALVSVDYSEELEDGAVSCDDHVTFLPLVDSDGERLPVHFTSEHQVMLGYMCTVFNVCIIQGWV